MAETLKFKIPELNNDFKVYFDIETGVIKTITNEILETEEWSHIDTTYEDVEQLISGEEVLDTCRVEFNTKLKVYELKRNSIDNDIFNVDELIYEVKSNKDSDIQIIQDIKNTCWKFLISENLRSSLIENRVSVKTQLSFSITEKNNPNILHRTITFPFTQLVNDFYVVKDFKNDYEFDATPVSVYTIKRFDSYSYEVSNG
jgi:hypothetical protein